MVRWSDGAARVTAVCIDAHLTCGGITKQNIPGSVPK